MHSEADEEPTPILPVGNPPRWRGVFPIAVGVAAGVLTLGSSASPRFGVPVAMLATLVVVFGVFDLLGTFDDDETSSVLLSRLAPWLGALVGSLSALLLLLRLAVLGSAPGMLCSIGVPLLFMAVVASLFKLGEALGPWRVDERGETRPLHRRHGFWLLLIGAALYLPMLGRRTLVDPWEPHYGEVAREVLARDDWISLWWAQEGWFWSKPVLSIWLQSMAMALTGVRYESGQMLSAVADGHTPSPEWAVRMAVAPLALFAAYLLYKAVAHSYGRRAGFFGGVVLLTLPQYYFVAQQTMTDMPFVALMASSVALFLLAVHTQPDERVPVYRISFGSSALRVSLYHLVLGAALLVIVPQLLYLLSRNVVLATSPHWDLRFVADTFNAGSPGNCGTPGNRACQAGLTPDRESLQPAVQMLLWLQTSVLLLWINRGERRRQRLLFLAAWLCAALATMAKGPAGLGFPVLCALAWVVATGRWRALLQMEIVSGLLIIASTAFPWWLAMYVRHGEAFVHRLFVHDMFKRAFDHVHDTNKGDDTSIRYYIWQLGYAIFPWSGLAPIALVRWLGAKPQGEPSERRELCLVLGAWFLIAFALFTAMGTKFHHYILPALPPLAMLVGILLDDLLRARQSFGQRALWGAAAVAAAIVTWAVGQDLSTDIDRQPGPLRLVQLFSYNYERRWPSSLDFRWEFGVLTAVAALLLFALVVPRWRKAMTTGLIVFACAFVALPLNQYMNKVAPHWGQRELLMHYERERIETPGRLIAYQLNWKGENFYRGNEVPAFVASGKPFQQWIDKQKAAGQSVFYFVTEHKRTGGLRSELGEPPGFDLLTDKVLNNKFVLVRARF